MPDAVPSFLYQWTGFALNWVATRGNELFAQRLHPLHVTPDQVSILFMLKEQGPRVQAHLSFPGGINKSKMVRLINELEEVGYVERRPHPADQRAILVHLTAKGEALVEKIIEVGKQVSQDIFSTLSASEQEILHQFLMRVVQDHIGTSVSSLERLDDDPNL